MICPSCKERTGLENDLYICHKCGAYEMKKGIWMHNGRVISAPDLVKDSLDNAKKNYPSGDWKE